MSWKKSKSGIAASITSDTHGAHRSIKSINDISVTVYRTKPEFKNLGSVAGFKEAMELAEKDFEESQ